MPDGDLHLHRETKRAKLATVFRAKIVTMLLEDLEHVEVKLT